MTSVEEFVDRIIIHEVDGIYKYLERLIAYDDEDTQAVRGNLKKAWRVWARILHVLRAENASPRVCGTFAALKNLEGFHVKAARRMTGMLPRLTSGRWKYPKRQTVLVASGLRTIEYFV